MVYLFIRKSKGSGPNISLFSHAARASEIATGAAVLATLAITRNAPFKGFTVIFTIINQPLMISGIVTAVTLLVFFAMIKVATGYKGLFYLVLAHSSFCNPFAFMPIRACSADIDLDLEHAAAEL